MSGGTACKDKGHRAGGAWIVVVRRANYSAFNGSRRTPSAYSEIRCLECGASWRSKGQFVRELRDARGDEGSRLV